MPVRPSTQKPRSSRARARGGRSRWPGGGVSSWNTRRESQVRHEFTIAPSSRSNHQECARNPPGDSRRRVRHSPDGLRSRVRRTSAGRPLALEDGMITLSRETSRFATSLIVRGTLLAFLGIAAIGWPDDALVIAMVVAAVMLAVLGAYEMLLAVRTRAVTPGWMVPMASGAACVSFAILTLVFPGVALGVTLLLVAVWLVLYASLTGALALAVWPMPRTRNALLGWTLLNLVLAVAAVSMPSATIFTLLYVGA